MRRTTYRKRQDANVMLLVGNDQSAGVASAFITPSRRHMAQNKTAPCPRTVPHTTHRNTNHYAMNKIRCIITICLAAMTMAASAQTATSNHNFEVAKNLDIFNALYRDLDLYYVDTLDAAKNIDNAANYMLEMLDPYTEYYAEDNSADLRQLTTGKYVGIGALTTFRPDLKRCIVAQPFAGMPADQVGILPGDIIMAIDGKQLDPCTSADKKAQTDYANSVTNQLRGEPGTTFELKVRRPTTGRTYTYKITRRNITRPSVTLAAMVADSVGYIRLSQFIDGTSNEIRRALVDLKQRGARRLVLDLRNNPGGVLEEAVKTVNLFIPRGREVVTTRSKVKELNHTYKTTLDAQDTDLPIIVLTNEGSASAAEITSGALQDYDRALIMGRRTYGKGLVQQSRELPYKGILKLTTGKYYIPSGRCVQAYKFEDGLPVHLPDSLAHEFRTAAGRIVRDGGGITPDVITPADSVPNLLIYLQESTQLFDYCVQYRAAHANIAGPTKFKLTDEEYADFCAYMKKHNFSYDRQSLKLLSTLRKMARFEGYETEAKAELDALESKLTHNEDYDFKRWEREIRGIVEGAIIEHFYYEAGREEHDLKNDKDVQQAVKMFGTPHQMHKILSGEPDA